MRAPGSGTAGEAADPLIAWVKMRRAQKNKSKSLSVTVPGLRIVDCTSPAAIEHIQRTNFGNYVKGSQFSDVMKDILGEVASAQLPGASKGS